MQFCRIDKRMAQNENFPSFLKRKSVQQRLGRFQSLPAPFSARPEALTHVTRGGRGWRWAGAALPSVTVQEPEALASTSTVYGFLEYCEFGLATLTSIQTLGTWDGSASPEALAVEGQTALPRPGPLLGTGAEPRRGLPQQPVNAFGFQDGNQQGLKQNPRKSRELGGQEPRSPSESGGRGEPALGQATGQLADVPASPCLRAVPRHGGCSAPTTLTARRTDLES